MSPEEKKAILKQLNDLCHITNGDPTPQRLKITLDVLQKFPFLEVQSAIEKGKHFWKFFPTPAEILEQLDGNLSMRLWSMDMKQIETKKVRKIK